MISFFIFIVVHEDALGPVRGVQFSSRFLARCLLLVSFFLSFATDYEAVVKLSDGFNGADLRNVCTEAGSAFKWIYFDQSLLCMLVMGLWEGFCCVEALRSCLMVSVLFSGSSGPWGPFLESPGNFSAGKAIAKSRTLRVQSSFSRIF